MKIVLLTRTDRPSGAKIAQAIKRAEKNLVGVIVEKRSSMVLSDKSLFQNTKVLLRKHGNKYILGKVFELIYIKFHYYLSYFIPKNKRNYLSIREIVRDFDLKLFSVKNHNSDYTEQILKKLKPDIIVLTNTRLIKPKIFNLAPYCINFHSSLLPKYKGLDSIFWALYNEESEVGVTVHFVDKGLDSGDIIIQQSIRVEREDDEKSLYRKSTRLAQKIAVDAITQIEEETCERKPQGKGEFNSYSWPTKRQRKLLRRKLKLRKKGKILFKNDKKRVLHVITRLVKGGAQQNTLLTVLGQRDRGYDVTLVTGPTFGAEGEIESRAKEEKVNLIKISSLVRNINPLKDAVSLVRLYWVIKRSKYHIVHTHTSKTGILGRIAAKLAGVPVIIHTPHGHIFHSYFGWFKTLFFLNLEKITAKFTSKIITLTDNCKREHIELGIANADKFFTVSSGIVVDKFSQNSKDILRIRDSLGIAEDRRIVGTVARLVPIKGVNYLINSILDVVKEYPDVHFLIVGDGWQKPDLEQMVIKDKLKDNVTFTGIRDDVPDLISAMDLFVLSSLNEGMGRVLVEAGLMGKASVATNVSGIPELIEHNKTGLLVESKNPAQLTEAILKLLKEPEVAKRMGKAAREKMLQGYSAEVMVDRISKLYEDQLK